MRRRPSLRLCAGYRRRDGGRALFHCQLHKTLLFLLGEVEEEEVEEEKEGEEGEEKEGEEEEDEEGGGGREKEEEEEEEEEGKYGSNTLLLTHTI